MPVHKPVRIILHCAQTPDRGDRYGSKQINKWHKKRGWKDDISGVSCGYHGVIRRSGLIEHYESNYSVRPESSIGAGVRGHNTGSLHICFMATHKITDMQFDAWLKYYPSIASRWFIPIDRVHGHNDYTKKKICPGFNVHILRLAMDRLC